MRDEIAKFYKSWLNKHSWSFAEAVALYCGYDPDTDRYICENHTSKNKDIKLSHKKRQIGSGSKELIGRDETFYNPSDPSQPSISLRNLI